MDMMMDRYRAIASTPENLYTGGDLSWTNMYTLQLALPVGTYIFTAAATSTDTDSAYCCVRFMTEDNQEASTEAEQLFVRSTAGEPHALTFHCTAAVHHLYLYASKNWPSGQGDTANFSKIYIQRIG